MWRNIGWQTYAIVGALLLWRLLAWRSSDLGGRLLRLVRRG